MKTVLKRMSARRGMLYAPLADGHLGFGFALQAANQLRSIDPHSEYFLLGMRLTQAGTAQQHFVGLARKPASASGSGTKASHAVQGDRPT